jgi:thiol-disulfide isomerase/thioredoxin
VGYLCDVHRPLLLLITVTALGCGADGSARNPAPSPTSPAEVAGQSARPSAEGTAPAGAGSGPAAGAPVPKEVLPFMHDDVPAAMKKAKAENKAVFVDAWAPWCHTCLSVKSYVLTDPSLKPLADRAVFVAIDTDREENAAFLEKHAISVWPTFFVIDPATDKVIGYWPGAASASEMRGFVEDSLRALEGLRTGTGARDPVLAHLTTAREAHSKRQYDRAAAEYGQAAKKAPAGSSWRSEALLGWVKTLKASGDPVRCARVGKEHIEEVRGAALPADYTAVVLDCADKLGKGSRDQVEVREAAVARLRKLTADPPPESSADDRADALAILGDALLSMGDKAGARRANEARLALMEKAAASAATPQMAATYDYGRALAYVALGRGEEAVKMLVQRERDMPDAYEPPARLADVLTQLGRYPDALAAVDRALPRAYGPRKLRYLKLKASLQAALKDRAGQIATLREEVAGYQALAAGQASAEKLADAKARLRAAEGAK